MLVLSRRQKEKIVFPNLGITVEVLSISGKLAKLGIEAPRAINVVRGEIPHVTPLPVASNHALRNRLNSANLALNLAARQVQQGLLNDATASLDEALEKFAELDQELLKGDGTTKKPGAGERFLEALLVEDNANESELLASFLRLSGIRVATAVDGAKALEHLACHDRPDVVLLDMLMPHCDGPATIAAIRGNPNYSQVKVFGVSGCRPDDLGIPEGPAGVDGWFQKPINPSRLVDEMNLLARR